MEWINGGALSYFKKDGKPDRRSELKDRLSTVTIDGVESQLKWLSMKAPGVANAYALFEEKESGRRWAAAVLTRTTEGKSFEYAIFPESNNPPYYECSKRILQLLTPLEPGEDPAAEEWRQKCWEEIRRKENPLSFDALPEGTQVIWTVNSDDWPFLLKGTRVKLVKENVQKVWYWKDTATGVLYGKNQVPTSDYRVLSE